MLNFPPRPIDQSNCGVKFFQYAPRVLSENNLVSFVLKTIRIEDCLNCKSYFNTKNHEGFHKEHEEIPDEYKKFVSFVAFPLLAGQAVGNISF